MRFELVTSVDPGTAFARVADFGKLEHWDPFVRVSRLEQGEPMTPGAVYRLSSLGGLTLRYHIVDVESPRIIVYQGGTDRVRSTDTIEVAPTNEGSRVTVGSELSFSGRMRLLGPVVRALVWLGGRFVSLPALRRHLADSG